MKIDKREILEDELLYIKDELAKLHKLIIAANTDSEIDVLVNRHHVLKEYSKEVIQELKSIK